MKANTIFFVNDQSASTQFYREVLQDEPILNVPGMTEFRLSDHHVLGLMPEAGIRRILKFELGQNEIDWFGIPRGEIYLTVNDPTNYHARALAAGAKELSSFQKRNWGHWAAYSLDPNGYIIAFASESI